VTPAEQDRARYPLVHQLEHLARLLSGLSPEELYHELGQQGIEMWRLQRWCRYLDRLVGAAERNAALRLREQGQDRRATR
jgi:hypothetical protein